MSIDAAKKTEIRDMIAESRKKPINFGLCLGKKLPDTALVLHRTKSPTVLAAQAKTEGGGAKSISGELKTEEKAVSLICAAAPPSGTARRLQAYLRLLGIKVAVSIVDSDGEVLEDAPDSEPDPGEGEGDDDQDESSAEEADPEAAKAALRGFLQTLPGDLKRLEGGDPTALAAAKALFAQGVAAAKAGDIAGALHALDSCTTQVGKLQSEARKTEAGGTIRTGTVADAVRQIEISAALWRTNRMHSIEGLVALIQELRKEEDPELHEIGERIKVLTQAIPARLAAALEDLETIYASGDQNAVSAGKAKVSAELQAAAAYLKANAEVLRNCEDNPWGIQIAIVKPLADAIRQIQASVSAI